MVRRNMKNGANRRSSQNKSGKSSSLLGPAINATSYRGPIVSGSQLSGNDTTVVNMQARLAFSGTSATSGLYRYVNFLNTFQDAVTYVTTGVTSSTATVIPSPSGQEVPGIFANYNSYRVLGIQVRWTPTQRYFPEVTGEIFPSTAFYCVLIRNGNNIANSIFTLPTTFNDAIIQPGIREIPCTDPWTMPYEYRGSSSRPVTWRANSLEDMQWFPIDSDNSNQGSGGIHIGVTDGSAVAYTYGYFLVSWRFQLKNMVFNNFVPRSLTPPPQKSPVELDLSTATGAVVRSQPQPTKAAVVQRFQRSFTVGNSNGRVI